jgi:hypothetical protein
VRKPRYRLYFGDAEDEILSLRRSQSQQCKEIQRKPLPFFNEQLGAGYANSKPIVKRRGRPDRIRLSAKSRD